ncbi:hypothetical protein K438DRAFT_1766520 [Mycena galopus ATCC 62051]|nr:hypothetical protein K438DRAFT_1766520 [Mycena galopus ATCC 62051]
MNFILDNLLSFSLPVTNLVAGPISSDNEESATNLRLKRKQQASLPFDSKLDYVPFGIRFSPALTILSFPEDSSQICGIENWPIASLKVNLKFARTLSFGALELASNFLKVNELGDVVHGQSSETECVSIIKLRVGDFIRRVDLLGEAQLKIAALK